MNNKQSRLIEWEGGIWTLADLARHHAIDYNLLWQRLSVMGWPLNKSLTTPVGRAWPRVSDDERLLAQRIIQHVRQTKSLTEAAKLFQLKPTYVSFACHNHKKRSGRPFCPFAAIRQIIAVAAQQGIKVPDDQVVTTHPDYAVAPASVGHALPKA